MRSSLGLFGLITAACMACASQPPAEPAAQQNSVPTNITERDWVLAGMSTSSTIIDTTRPPTLRLDAGTRAGGFAGCNRYSATFTLRRDSLAFGPIAATKMYCATTDHLERVFLTILERTKTYTLRDSSLTLRSHDGLEAIFRLASGK